MRQQDISYIIDWEECNGANPGEPGFRKNLADGINISKRYVTNKLFNSEPMQYSIKSNDRNKALEFIDLAANNVVGQLEGII